MSNGTPPAEFRIDEALVRALLRDQHPAFAHLPLRFAESGWDNDMFRLGDDFAVRLPRRQAGADLVAGEHVHLRRIAPRLPVPVPAPVAIGAPGRGYPWPWSVLPWIAGEASDLAPLDARQGPLLAAFLRALHEPADEKAPVNDGRGIRLKDRAERFGQCLDRLRTSSDLITPAIDNAWREALAAPVCDQPVWLHGDLHAQNVLSLNGALSGVIDWGDMCGGDPAVDLAAVWTLLDDKSARKAAIDAYGPSDDLLARAKGWAVLFGASIYETGRVDDPRHMAGGEATLRRLSADG